MARAASGAMPKAAIVIAVLTTLGALAFAPSAATSGGGAERVAPLAAGLLAWGAGVLLCFAASMRAFDRDREDGWDALLARHGARPPAYLFARVAGLAVVTLAIVLPGTVLAGVAAALASHEGHVARDALLGTLAGSAYAAAFSLVVAPIAVATLAPRDRASGYLWLLAVLVAPALVADWTGKLVPEAWSELVSVPGALDALRESLLQSDAELGLRAFAVLIFAALVAFAWARAQLLLRRSAT
jgi:hypothetical protein